MQCFVIMSCNIAAGNHLLDMLEEYRVYGHHIFVVAMHRTILNHPDLAISLDDLRLYLADLLINEVAHFPLSADNRLARFDHALGAQRVGLTWPTKRRLRFLPRFEQR